MVISILCGEPFTSPEAFDLSRRHTLKLVWALTDGLVVFDSDPVHAGHFGFARRELFHELWGDCFGMDVLDSSTIFGPLVVSHVGYDIAKDSGGVARINFLREENETQ